MPSFKHYSLTFCCHRYPYLFVKLQKGMYLLFCNKLFAVTETMVPPAAWWSGCPQGPRSHSLVWWFECQLGPRSRLLEWWFQCRLGPWSHLLEWWFSVGWDHGPSCGIVARVRNGNTLLISLHGVL